MRDEKGILPGIALGEMEGDLLRCERRDEASILPRSEKSRFGVEQILEVAGTFAVIVDLPG